MAVYITSTQKRINNKHKHKQTSQQKQKNLLYKQTSQDKMKQSEH